MGKINIYDINQCPFSVNRPKITCQIDVYSITRGLVLQIDLDKRSKSTVIALIDVHGINRDLFFLNPPRKASKTDVHGINRGWFCINWP